MNRRFAVSLSASFFLLTFTFLPAVRAQDAAEYKARADSEKAWRKEAVRGAHGMVATDEELASRAGVEILQKGGNAVRKALGPDLGRLISKTIRDSVSYGLDHREDALKYAMQFARDMEAPLAEKFVGMYVNHYTVDCGELVPQAAQKLLDMGYEAGLIPHRVSVEFVR